MLLSVEIMLNV